MKIIKATKSDLLTINDIYNSDIRKFILGKNFKKKFLNPLKTFLFWLMTISELDF